jgi:type I restriction enzyme, S subunit
MKAGWEIKKLGDVIQKTETVNPLNFPEYEFNYIDVSSVSNTTFQIEETQFLVGKDAPSRARRKVKENDVLFATIRPTLRRIAIVPQFLDEQVCSTAYFVLRPKKGIDHRYIFYWLFSEEFMGQMEVLQKGASYPAVTDAEVKAQLIPLPPLPEQRRIVAILDEAFAGIAAAKENAEQNLKNAKEVFEAHLQGILAAPRDGWQIKKIGDICKSIGYGTSSKSQKEGQVPVLRMGNIQDGKLDWNDLVYANDSAETEKYALREGDILFNRTNSAEHVGKTAIFRGEREAIFAGYLIRINVKRSIVDPEFLAIYLNSRKIREYGYSVMTSSVNQANISGSKLKEYPFLMPPLSEQRQIVSQLDSLSAEISLLESIYQQKLSNLEELKKSLLQQAFSGAL